MHPFSVADALRGQYQSDSTEAWFERVVANYSPDEQGLVEAFLAASDRLDDIQPKVAELAGDWVAKVRAQNDFAHAVDKLLQEYSLDNDEGVILMCLAEALMRIPDSATADKLIADKISPAQWEKHLGHSDSLFVNASTWALMLTGKLTRPSAAKGSVSGVLKKLLNSAGEPVIRGAVYQAMKIMGKQFVLGRTIKEALKNAKDNRTKGYTHSFDMLGEAALTDADADRYYHAYHSAIAAVGAAEERGERGGSSVSVKLSALHPRYEAAHASQVLDELSARLISLAKFAKSEGVTLAIDAEEADRLELSLQIFDRVLSDPELQQWGRFGVVVQAYSRRALPVLGYLSALCRERQTQMPIRLVKGAYWDSEIKWAQQLGQSDYPVFTRKDNTDLSYLVCAHFLLQQAKQGLIEPQFASHNAHTIASIKILAKQLQVSKFEFQRLHGMGESLYDLIVPDQAVRIYAPVGAHKDLLPYLVRRLLENGANSSFVHRLVDAETAVEDLVASPKTRIVKRQQHVHPAIPKPADLFGESRKNSAGLNLRVLRDQEPFLRAVAQWRVQSWNKTPDWPTEETVTVVNPARADDTVGTVQWCSADGARAALEDVAEGFESWRLSPVADRAAALRKAADLLEHHEAELISLCQREAGKTYQDSIDEIREAVDFLRYYAHEAETHFAKPTRLPGPTGELNEHYYEGRGVFLCISPWNFPLAIFLGQISAALVAGNTVIAKPAETTSLIAMRATEILHEAGIPRSALTCLPGSGRTLGSALLPDERIVGVAFTGSTATAKLIQRQLAERDGAIATLIAETGGLNAMIVDSTALPEQVVVDAMHSAFASAGQRCSALRILCVQDDIADRLIELLIGAMQRWQVGDPEQLNSDCGPVIDATAQKKLLMHIEHWRHEGAILQQCELPVDAQGTYVPPTLIELPAVTALAEEQFGPILHVVRYQANQLEQLMAEINQLGFGLTLGVHSRNEQTAALIERTVRVGNCYVNRNQIGAVVGVQPFGGRGLSGTGPKAGGPNYLMRFASERTRTINTSAVGGNASLLAAIAEDDE